VPRSPSGSFSSAPLTKILYLFLICLKVLWKCNTMF
jgi:hypothetical protein